MHCQHQVGSVELRAVDQEAHGVCQDVFVWNAPMPRRLTWTSRVGVVSGFASSLRFADVPHRPKSLGEGPQKRTRDTGMTIEDFGEGAT